MKTTLSLINTDGDDIVLAAISSGAGITDVGFTAGTYAGFIGIKNLDGSPVTIEASIKMDTVTLHSRDCN